MIQFFDLYNDESRSKSPKLIKTADGNIYKYNFNTRTYDTFNEDEIIAKHSVVQVILQGENILKTKNNMIDYVRIIRDDIVKGLLKLPYYNFDFVKPEQLIKHLVNESTLKMFKSVRIEVKDTSICETIDEASAGGCLIAKKGIHNGTYHCYDLNNSYNAIFTDLGMLPTNPTFKTVTEIEKEQFYRLYRLKVDKEFMTDEYKHRFKTTRRWFTKWDIDLFKLYKIKFELVEEENNCIAFDFINANFDWMEILNEAKQRLNKKREPIKYKTLKLILSSVWGQICKYQTQEQYSCKEKVPEWLLKQNPNIYIGEISKKYVYDAHPVSGNTNYIDKRIFFKHAIGIIKPFVLAYGRYRLLRQVRALEKKGFDVIYCHTDSIVTNANDTHFDIGTEIGQWKLETEDNKTTTIGVDIKHIGSKTFLK